MTRRLLLLAFILCTACAREPAFLERSVNNHRYHVWLPPRYTKVHHWPVVLYLHGSGGAPLESGLPLALQKNGAPYKCVVVIPECEAGHEWYGDMEQLALGALEQSIREFHGDRRRVVLTGISMGGAGTWYMARHRRRFAAVVPISGAIVRKQPFPTDPPPDVARIAYAFDPYAALAEEIGPRLPVWAFHGAKDDVIPASETRNMVAALQRLGSNVRYTEVPDAGDGAYADVGLVRWMLAQKAR